MASEQQDEQTKSEEEDDEIDIVGIKTEEEQVNNNCQEFISDTPLGHEDCTSQQTSTENTTKESSFENEVVSDKHEHNTRKSYEDTSSYLSQYDVSPASKDCDKLSNVTNNNYDDIDCGGDDNDCGGDDNDGGGDDDDGSLCQSANTSASSSRISSRRNSLNDSYIQRNVIDNIEVKHEMIDRLTPEMSDDDDDDVKEEDPYERFFFESDYLALKDNKHYHLLLQTLVALQGQRMQAIKDLDILCEEEAKALDDPIGFVEKLQNNEPLGLPLPQNVIKLPKIPWEAYASSLGPLDMSLPLQHHTRASTSDNIPQESQPTLNLFTSEATESITSDTMFSEASKLNVPGKLPTFNQPWTIAEQTKLEKLLHDYPQEDIEAKRWYKIAKALGNRTPKQVASRVQKYFIKLAKAGLPVPGRIPNVPRPGSRTTKRASHYQTMGFRNSTFFPSYQPRVYMNDNRDDDDESSIAFSDDVSSDDESIPEELRQTSDYMELIELKKIKRQKINHGDQSSASHVGFMCDGCGVDPIVGTRWHCQDCPQDASLDFCTTCIDRGIPESRGHDNQHRFEPISKAASFYVDRDYACTTGSSGTGYNYLDPNFLPAAS